MAEAPPHLAAAPRVREWTGVDAATFRAEIMPLGQPAVLRGLVNQWPAVEVGRRSVASLGTYLSNLAGGVQAETITGSPAIKGRLFYRADMTGLNFKRSHQSASMVIQSLVTHVDEPSPPAICMQAIDADLALPGFVADHPMPLVDPTITPRLWIGNALTVATHFDINENIACVVGGRRRFTLFPPDQLPNLYVGPFDFTPAGAPVSMVSLEQPDLERFPRFSLAMEAAQVAELEAGDAIYIPYMWWHGVQSLNGFNVLANYWWDDARPTAGSPLDVLLHALLIIRDLPPEHRSAWRAMFGNYVFKESGEPLDHLAPQHHGSLGSLDQARQAKLKAVLAAKLG